MILHVLCVSVFLFKHLLASHLSWIGGVEGLLTELTIFCINLSEYVMCEVCISITIGVFTGARGQNGCLFLITTPF